MIFRKLLFRLDTLAFAFLLLLAPCARTQSIYGDALQFTVGGPNQSVTVPNFGSIIPTNEITVEFWALSTAFATQSAFMLNPDQGTNRFNAHINYNSPSPGVTYWDFGNISGGGRLGPVPAPANSIGSWVHYAMVASQSGNYMRIYTNGVLQSSQTGMNTFVRGSYNLQIAGPGFPYGGILDEFRVWSVARTPAQIQADIYSILSGSESNLVVYYKFDSTSGTVATNSATATGFAYNGTVVNGPTWVSATIPLAVYVVTNIADSGPGTPAYHRRECATRSACHFRAGAGRANDPAGQRPDFFEQQYYHRRRGARRRHYDQSELCFKDFYHFQCDGCFKFLDPYQWKWQPYTRRRDPEQFRHRHPELLRLLRQRVLLLDGRRGCQPPGDDDGEQLLFLQQLRQLFPIFLHC